MRPTLRHKLIALAALAGSLLFAGVAQADSLETQWRAACTRDALTHCKLPKISSACRGVINATEADSGPTPVRPDAHQRVLTVR
jgi:hypothetical protein